MSLCVLGGLETSGTQGALKVFRAKLVTFQKAPWACRAHLVWGLRLHPQVFFVHPGEVILKTSSLKDTEQLSCGLRRSMRVGAHPDHPLRRAQGCGDTVPLPPVSC